MINWQKEIENIIAFKPPTPNPFRSISEYGVVLYGAGSLGEMALDLMSTISVKPLYMVDKNFQGEIKGINVISPEQIPDEDLKKLTFIVCISTLPFEPINRYLIDLGCRDIRHFYDYTEIALKNKLSNGWYFPNPSDNDKEKIKAVLKALEHDENSVVHYLQFLWWRLRRKEVLYPKYPVLSNKKYFLAPKFPTLTEHERLVDGGAHFGSAISIFVEITGGRFDYVWAFEPDEFNINILKRSLSSDVLNKVQIYDEALSDKNEPLRFLNELGYASKVEINAKKIVNAIKLDSVQEIKPTIIKLHLEGYELKALEGASETIKKSRPILIVLADHNIDGLYEIAHFLMNLDEYKLFFCLHDYCGNSAIFYCVPKERTL